MILGTPQIEFFVHGLPETKGSWISVGRGKMRSDNPRAVTWENVVAWHAKLATNKRGFEIFTGRVSVILVFVLPRPPNKTKKHRRDIDKLARACLDAMSKLIYVDDEQVDELHVQKYVSDRASEFGVKILVAPLLSDRSRSDEPRWAMDSPKSCLMFGAPAF